MNDKEKIKETEKIIGALLDGLKSTLDEAERYKNSLNQTCVEDFLEPVIIDLEKMKKTLES